MKLNQNINVSLVKKSKTKNKKWYNDVKNYVINEAKWKSANDFCLDNGMEFKILTEEHLNQSINNSMEYLHRVNSYNQL